MKDQENIDMNCSKMKTIFEYLKSMRLNMNPNVSAETQPTLYVVRTQAYTCKNQFKSKISPKPYSLFIILANINILDNI